VTRWSKALGSVSVQSPASYRHQVNSVTLRARPKETHLTMAKGSAKVSTED
jgi:hypothetical protein